MTSIAQQPATETPDRRPVAVTWGVGLLGLMLIVSIVDTISSDVAVSRSAAWFLAVAYGVEALLIVLVGFRYGWARWILLALTLGGVFLLLLNAGTIIGMGALAVVLSLASAFIVLVASALLFVPASAQWFAARTARDAAQSDLQRILAAISAQVASAGRALRRDAGVDPRLMVLIGIMAVVWIWLDISTNGIFLSARNLFNLSVQFAVVGIMATGMVLVIVTRNIDISVGSALGFIGCAGALYQTREIGIGTPEAWWLSALMMLAIGSLIGLVNGLIVAYLRVPALIVTLAGLMFYRNAAYEITQGVTVAPLDERFQVIGGGLEGTIGATWSWIVGGLAVAAIVALALTTRRRRKRYGFPVRHPALEAAMICVWSAIVLVFVNTMNNYIKPNTEEPMGIAVPVLILIGVAVVMTFIARRTRFGRYIYAIGGNPDNAELVGINVRGVVVATFTLMGFLAGLAAIVVTARLNAATNATGIMTELAVIAAAVVGGTSLAGGVGTVFGAVIGALFIQSLESGMVLLGLASPVQKMIIALVLVTAVVADMAFQRRRR